MPYPTPICIICGHFTLHDGKALAIPGSSELNVVVYNTTVTATSGSTMRARLFTRDYKKLPDGSTICAITKGGPMPPYGYLLHVSEIIPTNAIPPIYQSLPQFNRLSATGKVISRIKRISSSALSFDLATVTDINGNLCNWVFRFAYNSVY